MANFYLHELSRSVLIRAVLSFLLTDDVTILSQSTADYELFSHFLPPENLALIPLALATSVETMGDHGLQEAYVFAGGWTNRDYDFLFRAADRLPNVSFVVVVSARNKIRNHPPPNVDVKLDLPKVEFNALLASSVIVIVPLQKDVGSSGQLVLLTALRCGRPVVAPRVRAIREYIDDGVTGFLYELGDVGGLVNRIVGLLQNPEKLEQAGLAARRAFEDRFSSTRYVADVVRVLNGLDPFRDRSR